MCIFSDPVLFDLKYKGIYIFQETLKYYENDKCICIYLF